VTVQGEIQMRRTTFGQSAFSVRNLEQFTYIY